MSQQTQRTSSRSVGNRDRRWVSAGVFAAFLVGMPLPGLVSAVRAESAVREALSRMISTGRMGAPMLESLSREKRVRVLIVFDVPVSQDRDGTRNLATPAARAAIQAIGDSLLGRMGADGFEVVHRYSAVNALAGWITESGLARLSGDPAVRRVDLDEGGYGDLTEAVPLANVDDVRDTAGWSGAGVTAAVIDSGIDTDHPDLADDLVAEHCFCTGCCPGGGNEQNGAGSAEDGHGHGTNVSGIITSKGTAAPRGGAPDARIVAVKVLDSNNAFCCASDVVAALNWVAVNRSDVGVINASVGTSALYTGDCDNANSVTMAFASAINTLRANGVLTTASSGNQASSTMMSAPACVGNAISVAAVWDSNLGSQTFLGCTDATTAADKPTCFSNSNSKTDLYAPGAYTTSTGRGGGMSTFGGTSQAAPLVAACIADLLEFNPSLTPAQIEAALENSPTTVLDPKNNLSFPRLDCQHALGQLPAAPATPTPTRAPTATPTPQPCFCPDSDGDGKADAWDLCGDTPAGALTDASGCPGQSLTDWTRSPLNGVILLVALVLFAVRSFRRLKRPTEGKP